MQVDRFSITMDPELGAAVREAAAREGQSVSAWLASAAAERVRNHLLGLALDRWEQENSPLNEEELDRAARVLGITRRNRSGAS
jgi:hypothetical protein